MSDDFDDDFDFAEKPDDAEPEKIGMVVPARITDVVLDDGTVIPASTVAEVEEALYLEQVLSGILPIPFFDGDKCDPPSPAEAEDMMKQFGITVPEYIALMEDKS